MEDTTIKAQGKTVHLKKIGSLRYHGSHPNDINDGYERDGVAITDVVEGEWFHMDEGFHTSRVIKITGYNTFETKNSIYQIEVAA
jgi:hypothetical protein